MKYLALVFSFLLLFSCSSYKNVSYHDGVYYNPNDDEVIVNSFTTNTFRYTNIYQNDFIYAPFYLNTWNRPYWMWNTNRVYWYWNTWNYPNYYWNWIYWNSHHNYNPYLLNRRVNHFTQRSIQPRRITPINNNSQRPNSVRPTQPSRSNPSVRPISPPRSNPSVRPTQPSRSNPSVRPTQPSRSNPSVRPSTPSRNPSVRPSAPSRIRN
jgi:hypothetical protein